MENLSGFKREFGEFVDQSFSRNELGGDEYFLYKYKLRDHEISNYVFLPEDIVDIKQSLADSLETSEKKTILEGVKKNGYKSFLEEVLFEVITILNIKESFSSSQLHYVMISLPHEKEKIIKLIAPVDITYTRLQICQHGLATIKRLKNTERFKKYSELVKKKTLLSNLSSGSDFYNIRPN